MALKEKILDKAQKLIQKGYLDKAIAEYRAAAELDPRDISIRLRIGDLYVKLNKRADAIKEYTEVAKANSQRGFYLKAIAVYKQVLKLDETNLEIHYRLAELYTKQRLIADAISEYSLIVSTFERKGKTNDVVELLKKMAEIDPENVGVRLKLADLYQKLSFEKDALSEYAWILERLFEQGKYEKAEKIYLGLYNSNPREVEILRGLTGIYKRKGDEAQFLRFARSLFQILKDSGDTEGAKAASQSILEVRPDDKECLGFMERFDKKEEVNFEQYSKEETTSPPPPTQPVSRAIKEESSRKEEALISWPEEEIEITLEGFEEEPSSEPFKESEFAMEAQEEVQAVPPKEASRPEETAPPEVKFVEEKEPEPAEIEIELKEEEPLISMPEIGSIEPGNAAPAEKPQEEEIEIELKEEEIIPLPSEEHIEDIKPEGKTVEAAESEIDIELKEERKPLIQEAAPAEQDIKIEFDKPAVAAVEEVQAGKEEIKEETLISMPEVEDLNKEDIKEFVEDSAEKESPTTEDEIAAAIREAEESISAAERKAEEKQEDKALLEIDLPETEESPVEEIKEEKFKAEVSIEWPEKTSPESLEEPIVEEVFEPASEAKPEQEHDITDVAPEEISAEPVEAARAEAVEEPIRETGEIAAVKMPEAEAEEDLSEAISELMEKMGHDDMPIIPPDKLIEREKIEPSSEPSEDYVDLTAELGMEEALADLAQPWDKAESKETFDEFKSGIGHQLSREDTETHYNLGIAYMEMELHNEASKEFKIALKDPHLEFDCYIRLGLCAMAEHNPQEAIMFYLKGLKLEGKSEGERKGMMYELALAYEAAREMDEAAQLFNSIYEMDPHFREVAKKVKITINRLPQIPLDDGLIEVELL